MTLFANRLVENIIEWAMPCVGLVLVVMPLAFWVAWSEAVYFLLIGVTIGAGGLFCLLAWFGPSEAGSTDAWRNERKVLPDKFMAELQGLFPMVHHNRRPGDKVFQRKMDRIRTFLDD